MMSVGFYDFKKLHNEDFQKKILERFAEIVYSNGFVEGKYNTSFEQRFAKMLDVNHALLVANGTDALEIALQVYGIGHGDKVGVPSISFYATAECVINKGATPVFIDIDPLSGLMDPESLKRVLKDHDLKAIIPVHIYGQPAPIEVLEEICNPKGIKIIEDAAQGEGGFYKNGKALGNSNNLCTFSFYPTKNLAAFGDAGAITTNDMALAEDIISIRNHGRSPEGHRLVGRNSRCDHLQAAVLDLKLDNIQELDNSRKEIAAMYFDNLSELPIRLPKREFICLSSWHLFPIQVDTKDNKYKLKEFLATKNIGSALFYEQAMAEEKPISDCAGEKEKGISFAEKTLCLPIHPFVSKENIDLIKKTLQEFFR
jgi:dTDP-4-amino-4,6-dideoxygalactose transaminase